MFIRD